MTTSTAPYRTDSHPTPELVSTLLEQDGYPCVTLLLNTTPAHRILPAEAARLRHLGVEVRRRLREEGAPDLRAVVAGIDEIWARVRVEPADRALAVFVSPLVRRAVRLPLPVRERVVVDPTFATRDLLRVLHRTPPHAVLVLSGGQARLFEGMAGGLAPALRTPFPLLRARSQTSAPGRQDRGGDREPEENPGFLREVDQALGTYLRLHPSPVVLVGAEPTVSTFRGLSRNLPRLAGVVRGSHDRTPLPALAALVRPVLDEYLHGREREAVALLEQRMGTGQVASGLAAAWFAARHDQPEMLAVEDSLYVPARLSPDGDLLTPADDVEHPDVLDDAVDELIELVIRRGGWVALARPGALSAHDGVALTLRGGAGER